MKKFTLFQLIQLAGFLAVAIYLSWRSVDGTGAIQTLDIKLANLSIWGKFYLGLLAVEWIPYLLARLLRKSHK